MPGVDDGVTGPSCATRVKDEWDVTAFCPRVEYRLRLRVPAARSRQDDAHHYITTPQLEQSP